MTNTADDWLNEFNSAAQLAQQGSFPEALAVLNELAPRLTKDPTLTPKFHVMFELRRAYLCSMVGDRNESLRRFSAAMKIAFEQVQEDSEVCTVYRQLLETIRNWKDWKLLLETAKRLCILAGEKGFRLAALEASYHMPFAYQGIGERQQAREYAMAILQRAREVECQGEIDAWTEFIRELDTPLQA